MAHLILEKDSKRLSILGESHLDRGLTGSAGFVILRPETVQTYIKLTMPYTIHSAGITDQQSPTRILIADPDAKRRALLRGLVSDSPPISPLVFEAKTLNSIFKRRRGGSNGADTARPDIVLVHLDLLDGLLQSSLFATSQESSSLPIVLVGEREDDPRADAGLAAGAQDYLVIGHLSPIGLRRALTNAQVRYQLAQNVAASDAHFRALADSTPVMIWVSDTTKSFIYFNRAWLDFSGRSLVQELAFGWADGIHPDDRERCLATYSEAFDARRPFVIEYRFCRHDGVYCWLLEHGAPRYSPDGTFLGYSGSCTDITERRLAEEELRASEARLRELAALVPQIIWVADANGSVEYVNERWIEYTGRDLQQSLGRGTLSIIHPDDLRQSMEDWTQALSAGIPFEGEMRLRAADGSYAWFLVRCLPVRNEAGVITKWLGTSTNIDTRKRAELVEVTLARMVDRLRALDQPEAVAQALVTELSSELSLDRCIFGEVDWGVGRALIHAFYEDGRLLHQESLPLVKVIWPVPAAEIAARRAVAVADLALDARTAAAYAAGKVPDGLRAAVVIPFKKGERGIGLLVVGAYSPRTWSADEIELLERLAMPAYLAFEKAQAEQAVLEQTTMLQLALDTANLATFDMDLTTGVVRSSDSLDRIYGLPPQSDPRPAAEYRMQTYPGDTGVFDRSAAPARGSDSFVTEYRIVRPHGDVCHLYGRARLLYNESEEPSHLVGAVVDITERTRAEERLAFLADASRLLSSSLNHRETLQRVSDAMVPNLCDWCAIDLVTPDGQIELVSISHVDPAKVKWAYALRRRFPPSMDDPVGLAAVIRSGEPEFHPDIDLERVLAQVEDEEIRQIILDVGYKSAMIVPLRARDQTLGALTLVWSDSDRHYDKMDLAFTEELARRAAVAIDNARLYEEARRAETELRSWNETLEQRVAERTAELVRSNQELDQFTYVASHDLKAPLRALDHLATWIDEDVRHLLPDRSREHLSKMRGRIQRMERLLDDLLAYSRADRQMGEVAPVVLSELVQHVVETVAVPDPFRVVVSDSMPTITTLHVPLETVLRNLLSNAIKHHDKSAGQIEIEARLFDEELVEFIVRDDGPGIAPVYHERIFQMFQTLLPRDQREGSGVGLAIVKKIVDAVGGTVWVESQPGGGAAFHFTWPTTLTGQGKPGRPPAA